MTFEEIYTSHVKMVFNLTLHYVQTVEEAEEISQDVFVKVHEKLDEFRHEADLKTWIYRITINKSLDFIRSKKRMKRGFLSGWIPIEGGSDRLEAPASYHPGIALEHKEYTQHILNAMNNLSENQKTVLILLKIEMKSQQEAAQIMNLSIKAIDSLFQRAKAKLYQKISNEGI